LAKAGVNCRPLRLELFYFVGFQFGHALHPAHFIFVDSEAHSQYSDIESLQQLFGRAMSVKCSRIIIPKGALIGSHSVNPCGFADTGKTSACHPAGKGAGVRRC
jgi:hypothetical protein